MEISKSIEVLVKSSEEAQKSTRFILGTVNIACWIFLTLIWNNYFSWSSISESKFAISELNRINNDTFKTAEKLLLEERIKSWFKSHSAVITFLGTSVDIDDIVPISATSLFILMIWTWFCMYRELKIITTLFSLANDSKDVEIQKYIYYGISSASLFSGFVSRGFRNRIGGMLFTGLLFLPMFTSMATFICDVRSLYMNHYLRSVHKSLLQHVESEQNLSFLFFWYAFCVIINILLFLAVIRCLKMSNDIDLEMTLFTIENQKIFGEQTDILEKQSVIKKEINTREELQNYISSWRSIYVAVLYLLMFCFIAIVMLMDLIFQFTNIPESTKRNGFMIGIFMCTVFLVLFVFRVFNFIAIDQQLGLFDSQTLMGRICTRIAKIVIPIRNCLKQSRILRYLYE
jgi:hypothetical protein